MSTAVATTNSNAIIPQANLDAIDNMEAVLDEVHQLIVSASPLKRAFVTASAIIKLENAITKEMMADIMHLMNNPLGFKTDRKPGALKNVKGADGKWTKVKVEPYHELTVKRCVISALIVGAQLAGNEFNIIASQAYFTKEFFQRIVLEFPGLRNFEMLVGPAAPLGGKTAVMDGHAQWEMKNPVTGEVELHEVKCMKGTDGLDRRLVTNCSDASGPDQLRGVGESKLLRRVYAKLTGMNIDQTVDEQLAEKDEVVDGKIKSPLNIEKSKSEPVETEQPEPDPQPESKPEPPKFADYDKALDYCNAAEEVIGLQDTLTASGQQARDFIKKLDSLDWSEEAIEFCRASIGQLRDAHNKRLKAMKK